MLISMRKESGFTLVELMIGLLVGLMVMGGVLSVYISTVKSSGSTLKSSRLNQEMGTIMNIMASDIRRAGFWASGVSDSALNNPFSQTGSTALEVQSLTGGTYGDAGVTGSGSCVVYTYDRNKNGVPNVNTTPDEGYGFRWDDATTAIKIRVGVTAIANINDCNADAINWRDLTDTNFMTVTGLTFSLASSQCLNSSEPNQIVETTGAAVGAGATEIFAERDCYNATYAPDSAETNVLLMDTDEITVEIREVLITMKAELADDPGVAMTMTQSVQVRNNHLRKY